MRTGSERRSTRSSSTAATAREPSASMRRAPTRARMLRTEQEPISRRSRQRERPTSLAASTTRTRGPQLRKRRSARLQRPRWWKHRRGRYAAGSMDAHLPKITGEGGVRGPDPKAMKPYGDMWDDGLLQISFTLPMEAGPEAREAATQYLQKHGFKKIGIHEMGRAAEGFSFFVAYVQSPVTIEVTKI